MRWRLGAIPCRMVVRPAGSVFKPIQAATKDDKVSAPLGTHPLHLGEVSRKELLEQDLIQALVNAKWLMEHLYVVDGIDACCPSDRRYPVV